MVRYVIEQGKVGVLEKEKGEKARETLSEACLLYTSPSPRD